MKTTTYIEKNFARIDGKTVAISGATGGIGNHLAEELARLGARLILLDRNSEKSNALIAHLKTIVPTLDAKHIRVDLEEFDTVRAAADELENTAVDYLILNAGAYSIPRRTTSLGYDNVFQINFISPYYLARRLLPGIKERGGRVIAVGSIAHGYSKTDKNDIDFATRGAASKVYGNAKRYLMFSLLHEFGGSGAIAIAHPGITFTNITAHYPKLIFAIIKHPMKIIFMPPRRAALSILQGIYESTNQNEWIGPKIFNIWGLPKKQKLCSCKDEEIAFISKTAREIYESLI